MDHARPSSLTSLEYTAYRKGRSADLDASQDTRPAVYWIVIAIVLLAAAAALFVDLPLARWCISGRCPADVTKLFNLSELFGHGLGIALVALSVYQLDPRRRWAIWRFLAIAISAGLMADLVKMLVVRVRPYGLSAQHTALETFGAWLPLFHGPSSQHSFPSGHTAVAVAVAIALSWLYPRGRWLFALLAVLVACQRITGGHHYLSDSLVGGALGGLSGSIFLNTRRISSLFDRLERWLRDRAVRVAAGDQSSIPAVPGTAEAA